MPMSGKAMIKMLEKRGWVVLRQNGSHVVLGKGGKRVVVPMHRELKTGTERAILKQTKE